MDAQLALNSQQQGKPDSFTPPDVRSSLWEVQVSPAAQRPLQNVYCRMSCELIHSSWLVAI